MDVLFKFFIAPLIIITKQVPLAPQSALRLFLSWTEYPRLLLLKMTNIYVESVSDFITLSVFKCYKIVDHKCYKTRCF